MVVFAKVFIGETNVLTYKQCSNGYHTKSFDRGKTSWKNKVKWEEMASMLLIML